MCGMHHLIKRDYHDAQGACHSAAFFDGRLSAVLLPQTMQERAPLSHSQHAKYGECANECMPSRGASFYSLTIVKAQSTHIVKGITAS